MCAFEFFVYTILFFFFNIIITDFSFNLAFFFAINHIYSNTTTTVITLNNNRRFFYQPLHSYHVLKEKILLPLYYPPPVPHRFHIIFDLPCNPLETLPHFRKHLKRRLKHIIRGHIFPYRKRIVG